MDETLTPEQLKQSIAWVIDQWQAQEQAIASLRLKVHHLEVQNDEFRKQICDQAVALAMLRKIKKEK